MIFLFAVFIQLLFLNPPILSDQMEYYITAVRFPHLPEKANIASMRLGLILPVAAVYRIFGHSEITYYSISLLTSAILGVSMYFFGSGAASRRVGVLSAIWILLIPNVLLWTGHLLPDVPSAAAFTTGIALLVSTHPVNSQMKPLPKKSWIYFGAGLLFGWAYLAKEYIAVLFVLIPILFRVLDIPKKYLIPTAAGMLLMLGLEMVIGQIYYQNPLIRFLAASPRETAGHIETDVSLIVGYFPRLLNRRGGVGTTILSAIGTAGSLILAFRKKRIFLFLFLWTAIFYIFFTLMGLLPVIFSWEDIVLLRLHKFRYWIPILPPLIISGMAVLESAISRLADMIKAQKIFRRSFITGVMLLALIGSAWFGLAAIWDHSGFVRNGADHYHELRAFLRGNGDQIDAIWVTRDNRRGYERMLPIYSHDLFGQPVWKGRLKYLNTDNVYLQADEVDTGFVIIDRDFNDPGQYGVPEYMSEIPENWRMVFESENQKLALYSVD